MSRLKGYFSSRIGKPMAWSFEAGDGLLGAAHRRDYAITVRGIEGDVLVAEVGSQDFDRDGKRLSRVANDHGEARLGLRGAGLPLEVLEDLAREADPSYFSRHPRQRAAAAGGDGIEQRLRALSGMDGRGKDDGPPTAASIERFRRFWSDNPGLVLPDVFSSKDGTIRARWQDGADRTLWIHFPPEGRLGWRVLIPRDGDYGLRQMNAICPNDRDIIPMARLLGVGTQRS